MKILKILENILKWRFDVFERYQPCIKRLSKKGMSILEIGAGEYGLKYFGFKNVRETDVNNGRWEYLDITKPISDNFPQFDVVVAIDVIEHIIPKKKMLAIEQMYRVAKRKIILSVPNSLIAYEIDKKLDKLFDKKGFRSKHLKEHIKHGVFNFEDFVKELKKSPQTKKVEIFNGIDIRTHQKIAQFLFSKSKSFFLFKNKFLYPMRNLIISLKQTNTPYHKTIEVTLK